MSIRDSINYNGKVYTLNDVPNSFKNKYKTDVLGQYVRSLDRQKKDYIKNKEARNKRSREDYIKNKEHYRKLARKRYDEKKEEIIAQTKEYYQANRDIILKKAEVYREKNKDEINKKTKLWRESDAGKSYYASEKHKKSLKKYKAKYCSTEKGKIDAFRDTLRNLFRSGLRIYSRKGKIYKAEEYGIYIDLIHNKLEKEARDEFGMTIPQMRELGYHIDHLIAMFFFDLNDPKEIIKCFHPDNLRWLPGFENISKHNKI